MNRIPQINSRICKSKRLLLIAGLLIALCSGQVFADSTGTIMGIVTDSQTGLPIPGARVMIDSTSMGAMVDAKDGSYIISNVPAGEYTLKAGCIGYRSFSLLNVIAIADSITEVNFRLVSEAIRVGGVRRHGAPYLDFHGVSKVNHLEKKNLNALPYQSIDKVIKSLCD